MLDRAATVRKAIEILGGPCAEDILRESMRDLEFLIELGALEVDVAYTRQRLTASLEEPRTADDLARQFGAHSIAQDILKAAGHPF